MVNKWIYNPFINLPFLVDVEKQIVISQTNAILTYLNRQEVVQRVVQQPAVVTKQALVQQQQQEQVKVEELLCEIMDLRNQMVRFAYGKRKRVTSTAVVAAAVAATTTTITSSNHYDEVDKVDAKLLLQSIQPILTKFQLHFEQRQQQLQKQQQEQQKERQQLNSSHFLVGNTYTVADFHLWEMLDQYINLIQYYKLDETDNDDNNDNGNNDDASLLSSLLLLSPPPSSIAGQKSKNLLYNFYTNFKQLPENQSYLQCNIEFNDLPYNNPYARYGSAHGRILHRNRNKNNGRTSDSSNNSGEKADEVDAEVPTIVGDQYIRGQQPIPSWKRRGIIDLARDKIHKQKQHSA